MIKGFKISVRMDSLSGSEGHRNCEVKMLKGTLTWMTAKVDGRKRNARYYKDIEKNEEIPRWLATSREE